MHMAYVRVVTKSRRYTHPCPRHNDDAVLVTRSVRESLPQALGIYSNFPNISHTIIYKLQDCYLGKFKEHRHVLIAPVY